MSSIDKRIVEMKFDNKAFEKNIQTTLSSLEKLKSSLNFKGAQNGLTELQSASDKFNLNGVGEATNGISAKFLAMSTVALTALANITTAAISAGARLAKSFTIDPLKDGLAEYETQLNSVQTILSNTQSKGTNIDDVNTALDELNHYADKTIYNFGEMARNIGTFTAAGVDLDTSVNAIKGISNLAAASGSSSLQASTAMYQLSQALATGTVKLMDWNSVVNAGMGGELFQEALKETARVHGVAIDDIIAKEGSFRDSLHTGWLSTDILNETLSQFAGEMSEDQLRAAGYSEESIQKILQMGQTATDAATKVKTFTQLMGTLRESAGSGWAQSWETIIGDFEEAKELWTGVNDVLGGAISASAEARNAVLNDWDALGGRAAMIDGIKNAFQALMSILKPIGDAFREIFPRKTGQDLMNMTVAFRDFMANLKLGSTTAENLKRTFKGLFAIFSIGWQIVKGLFSVFGTLVGALGGAGDGILGFTGNIGDFLVYLDETLKKGDSLKKFFKGLGDFLSVPLEALSALTGGFSNLSKELTGGFTALIAAFKDGGDDVTSDGLAGSLESLGLTLRKIIDTFKAAYEGIKKYLGPMAEDIKAAISNIGAAFSSSIQTGDFEGLLKLLNTGLLGGIFLAIRKFFSEGLSIDLGGGFFAKMSESLDGVTEALGALQAQLKSKALLNIAIAIGILALSLLVLASIDPVRLAAALTAMTAGFAQLVGTLQIMSGLMGVQGIARIPIMAASLVILAIAILVLTSAVKRLSEIKFTSLAKGVIAIGALMGVLIGAMKVLAPLKAELAGVSAVLLALSLSMLILSYAVQNMSSLSWEDLGKGMAGLATSLGLLIATLRLLPAKSMSGIALGFLGIATALLILTASISTLANMTWSSLVQGLAGIAATLFILAAAMNLMPKNMALQSLGLLAISVALNVMALALSSIGNMSLEQIGKALIGLAGGLLILVIAMNAASGAASGAAAIALIAAALAVFIPVLITLGNVPWYVLLVGLVALAAIFVVLGAAAYLLAPLAPVLASIALSLLGMGAAFALFGVGALAFAKALEIVGKGGDLIVGAILKLLEGFIGLLPTLIGALGEGIVLFLQTVLEAGPLIVNAIVEILSAVLTGLATLIPQVGEVALALIITFADMIIQGTPKIVEAGLTILMSFLRGINDNITEIINTVSDIIVKFIEGVGTNIPKIIQAGIDLAIDFLGGVADGIRNNMGDVIAAALDIGVAIVEGLWDGLLSLKDWILDKLGDLFGSIWDWVKDFLGISSPSKLFAYAGNMMMEGLGRGVDDDADRPVQAVQSMAEDVVSTLSDGLAPIPGILDGVVDMDPVISPVLDLDGVNQEAKKLNGLFSSSLDLSSALNDVANISAAEQQAKDDQANNTASTTPTEFKFEQNNYSPKALSPIEIYRNTKNQLSVAKETLGV